MESSKPKIAVIVPTIREECFSTFMSAWFPIFKKHDVVLVKVEDGDDPVVKHVKPAHYSTAPQLKQDFKDFGPDLQRSKLEPDILELFSDHNPACRNLGFYYAAAHLTGIEIFMTLDDDCYPIPGHDTVQEHLRAMNRRWPVSWFSTTDHAQYMRGFPYGVRSECEAVVSHGLWNRNPDYDAPTDLHSRTYDEVTNDPPQQVSWYAGPIPRGVFAPICGMNVAFKREVLPYYYHCPVEDFPGAERFDDIWMGIELKKAIDKMPGKCIVSGCAYVDHLRESNPLKNLAKEAIGIDINETLWRGEVEEQYRPFFDLYRERRERYEKLLKEVV